MVKTYIYPNNKSILVSDNSLYVNPHTWENTELCYEYDSIDYVYSRLQNIINEKGSARLLDVGAQSGLYTLYSKYFDNLLVDSFEPFPESYKCLLENISLNNIEDRVTTYSIALSEKKEKTFLKVPNHTGLNTLGNNPQRFDSWKEVAIETDTLDNLYQNKRIDFIKCDTEGWEYFVLMGGLQILERDRPEIFLEIFKPNLIQCGINEDILRGLLEQFNYKQVAFCDGENYGFISK